MILLLTSLAVLNYRQNYNLRTFISDETTTYEGIELDVFAL